MQYTYATLTAMLIKETADQSSEFATAIPTDIIPLAEIRLLRDLDLTIFDEIVTGLLTPNTPLTPKPSDCLVTRELFYINSDSEAVPLVERDYTYALDYWPVSDDITDTPKYRAEYDATNWYIAGTPSTPFAYRARCMIRPDGLSVSNATTWLSTNVGDVLRYAALVASAEFLQQTEQLTVWASEYSDRLSAAKKEFWMLRRQAYMPLVGIPTKTKQE